MTPLNVAAQATPAPTTAPAAAAPATAGSALTDSAVTRLSVPIGGKQEVRGLPDYIDTVYRYMLGTVTILAIIMVMYGAFLFLLSQGDSKRASEGMKVIKDAIGGMAVLFLAYFILYNVNPRTTRLDLLVTPVRSIALQQGGAQAAPGRSCLKDADCTNGAKCLRTSATGGICADGQSGNICKCRGTGCDVTGEQAGGPTNNGGTNQITCREGLNCQEIQAGEWVCNGGVVMACNMSEQYTFDVRAANERVASGVGSLAASAVAGPFAALIPASSSSQGSTVQQRTMVPCSEGRTCFQRSEQAAGACVYGDHRDMAMIQSIPEERRNTYGILRNIERCDLTAEQLRTLPYTEGGCRNITNGGVDEFCVRHRYQCGSGSVCSRSEFADAFSVTLAQYRSWENVPAQLRPEAFFQGGCRKPAGTACSADAECAGKCVLNRCSGIGFVSIDATVAPGTLRFNQLPAQNQVIVGAAPAGSCDSSWSAVDLLTLAGTDVPQRTRALEVLFQAGTPARFACYPKRATGNKCDFNTQCQSGDCAIQGTPSRVQVLPTFNAPLDLQVGLGTCR